MKRLMIGLFAACAVLSATAANEYYVDAVNGADDESHDGSSWAKAKKTLSVACALATEEGDTVYVAEGDYKTGSDGTYRAKLAAGVKLIGVGDKNKIRIFGSATGATRSETPLGDDLRCISGGDGTLVKNVTLCNGRGYGVNGGAGSATYWVACVFSNNYVNINGVNNRGRGGALGGGTAIRCIFKRNSASSTGKCVYGATCWNCVFDQSGEEADPKGSYVSHNATTYNCTVSGTGGCSVRGNSHYNLLCLVVDGGSADTKLYSSLFSEKNNRGNVGDARTLFEQGKDALPLDAGYRPLPGNIGIDYGSNLLYSVEKNFPNSDLVADQKYLDFNGNPRIIGAAIDVGACEFDPDDRLLSISDAQTGLTVMGAEKGDAWLRRGETNTFTLARNYSTQKLCTGVRVNGEFFSFTGENADKTYEYTYGYGDPTTSLVIEAVYAEHNDWYVNPTTGDDVNNNGYTRYQAKKTIAAAMTNELIAAGDTVHAAPGVYRDAPFGKSNYTTNRVTVAADVGLVSDEGPDVTVIEGEKNDPYSASIRCVGFAVGNTTGYVKGFTLRNGSTAVNGYSDRGGGVYGGTAVDCVITNCSAVRGGGAYNARLIRCIIKDCSTLPVANANAAGCYTGTAYDSYIANPVLDMSKAVNCVFGDSFKKSSSNIAVAYNCLVNEVGGGTYMTNCMTGAKSMYLDADFRPKAADSALVDAGGSQYYVYPSAFASEAGKDLMGGQRIYNGKIDIGCGEYDWRGDFTAQLEAKGVAVEAASANVTTNDLAGLVLSDGDTLKLKLVCKADGKASLKVVSSDAGGGNVTVRVGETEVPGVDGLYAFDVSAGETLVEISFAGTETATLSDVTIPKTGMLLLLR